MVVRPIVLTEGLYVVGYQSGIWFCRRTDFLEFFEKGKVIDNR